jgi:hypothetical protein
VARLTPTRPPIRRPRLPRSAPAAASRPAPAWLARGHSSPPTASLPGPAKRGALLEANERLVQSATSAAAMRVLSWPDVARCPHPPPAVTNPSITRPWHRPPHGDDQPPPADHTHATAGRIHQQPFRCRDARRVNEPGRRIRGSAKWAMRDCMPRLLACGQLVLRHLRSRWLSGARRLLLVSGDACHLLL